MSGGGPLLPLVTPDLPGSGGEVKASPEDFRVDELPAYLPEGSGPHLWVKVEKRGRTTRDVVRELAAVLGVPERDAGCAGLKDRNAVTTQWLSFPSARDPEAGSLAGDGYRVTEVSRHRNKLRTGHLRGNRFSLTVRGGDAARAAACAEALRARGLANFFGEQRFGVEGKNADLGHALLAGQSGDPAVRRAGHDRFLRRLVLSAWQSRVFNRWLAERMADGLFAVAIQGDVLKKLASGGTFTCVDPEVDTARIAAFEISPAGPMFGHALPLAAGLALEREERLLVAEGLSRADLARGGGETEGTRRAGRIPVSPEIEPLVEGAGYRVSLELPKGSYATVVLRELVKPERAVSLPGED